MVVRAGREFLAIPGPTTMPDEVLRAMHRPAIDIYAGSLLKLTDSLLADLARLFRTRGSVYIYIANGHGAWEAALTNVLSRADKILVLESGRFALGWGNMAAALGVEVEVLPRDYRRAVDPAAVAARLRCDKDNAIKAVLTVQVDTASGVVNDIAAIGKAIRTAGHDALFMVDAVASLACVPFDMDAWGVDVAMSGSQKGLMTPVGLSFVAVNARAKAAHKRAGLRTPYWDWTSRDSKVHYQKYAGTPPEHHMFALGAARRRRVVRTQGDRFQHHACRRALRHRHHHRDDGRLRPVARLLQREMRRRAWPGPRRYARQGVPHRPYGARQCPNGARHARRRRVRAGGTRHPASQRRRAGRRRLVGQERKVTACVRCATRSPNSDAHKQKLTRPSLATRAQSLYAQPAKSARFGAT
jgi:aspartate aminotransferase-like enzyme